MAGRVRLAQVFVELADTRVAGFDPADLLQLLADRCVELLDADAAVVMLAGPRHGLQLLAATDDRAGDVGRAQLDVGEGPGLDCFRTGTPQAAADLAGTPHRWPLFSRAALAAGFGAVHSLPLQLRGDLLGTLDLCTVAPHGPCDEHVAIAQAMADVATIGLLHERTLHDRTVLSEQLQAALTSRVLIEQAKGVLAARSGISLAEAFTRMRSHARRHGLALTDVARSVVEGTADQTVLLPT